MACQRSTRWYETIPVILLHCSTLGASELSLNRLKFSGYHQSRLYLLFPAFASNFTNFLIVTGCGHVLQSPLILPILLHGIGFPLEHSRFGPSMFVIPACPSLGSVFIASIVLVWVIVALLSSAISQATSFNQVPLPLSCPVNSGSRVLLGSPLGSVSSCWDNLVSRLLFPVGCRILSW